MAIAYRGGATNIYTTGTQAATANITVVVPASVQPGDVLMLGYLAMNLPGDTGGQGTISAPTGGGAGAGAWTAMSAQMAAANSIARGWYRVAVAGDAGATLTVGYTGDTVTGHLQCVLLDAWSGVDTTNPLPVIGSANNSTSSTTQVLPTIDTTGHNQCWVAGMYLGRGGTVSMSTVSVSPAGWTVRNSANPAGGSSKAQGTVVDNGTPVSAGPGQGGATITLDQASVQNYLYTFALAPASTSATVQPNADVTTTSWTPSQTVPGGTPMCSLVADGLDSTYVFTGTNPTSQVWEAKLPSMAAAPNTVKNRGYFGGGAANGTVVTALIQGTTVIASRTDTYTSPGTPPPTTPTDWLLTLTGAQQAAITNLADLRIRCTMTAS